MVSCQCQNLTCIHGTKISANDLSQVEIISKPMTKKGPLLTNKDLEFQEKRRNRKVRKLDFDVK